MKSRVYPVSLALASVLALAGLLTGEASRTDEEQTREIRSYTTRPEFLSPLVDHVPASVGGVPSPKDILGYTIGTPKKLTYYADEVRYFQALAEKSPRVELWVMGQTNEGKDHIALAVSSEENIRDMKRYAEMTAALADPRKTSQAEAQRIIAEGKPFYTLIGGHHSGETGSPEMLMELGYRLAVSDDPLIERIRNDVIVLFVPVMEPDGRDRYVDWYYRHLMDISDDEDRITGPPYWGKYVFHDNNRDGIQLSQPEIRNVLGLFNQYHPQVMHDLHESIPFTYISTGTGPNNPSYDPIVETEMLWLAHYEMAQMTKFGMPGVWVHDFWQQWYPGYTAWIAANRNAIGRFYETFGNGGATTMKRKLDRPSPFRRRSQTTREWYRPIPPYKEVEWSIRNNVNYSQTGVLSALDLVSRHRETLLENFWKKSWNAVENGKTQPPYAWVIPSGQGTKGRRDADGRAAALINLLRLQGVEVHRLSVETTVASAVETSGPDGVPALPEEVERETEEEKEPEEEEAEPAAGQATLPAGSYVVRMDQPYRNLAKMLLEVQRYPENAPRSYDNTGWTLGQMFGVRTLEVKDPAILEASMELLTEDVAGAYNRDRALAESYQAAGSPRIGVVYSWRSTQPTGWIRYTFDKLGIPFRLVNEERLRKGDLGEDFDVLVFGPAGRGTARDIVKGIDPAKTGPLAYTKTERFQFLGAYDSTEDITGGMGLQGVLNLEHFVRSGGTLITIGSASLVPIELGIARHIDVIRPSGLIIAGSVVKAVVANDQHPATAGYGKEMAVPFSNAPVFSIPESKEKELEPVVVLRYAKEGLLLSGLAEKAEPVEGKPAVLDLPLGKGHLVMFSFNPLHRWQSFGTFDLFFNTVFAHGKLPGLPKPTS